MTNNSFLVVIGRPKGLVVFNNPSSHPHTKNIPQIFAYDTRMGIMARTVNSTVPVGGLSASDVAFPLTTLLPPAMPGYGEINICMDTL